MTPQLAVSVSLLYPQAAHSNSPSVCSGGLQQAVDVAHKGRFLVKVADSQDSLSCSLSVCVSVALAS